MKTIIFFSTLLIIITGCVGDPPQNLGLSKGSFAPCPKSPNCVSSQLDKNDSVHYITPLCFVDNLVKSREKLHAVITKMGGTTLIKDVGPYIYYTYTIPLFGFVDDVEFFIDEANKVIHVRSASRVGQGDLGVNRSRIEEIRKKLCD
ncbi:MAG: DUF1499 domain-containing protein [Spirochaetales bacterium]|nr:DUF1499 domain-containing protein [Spirochaetales bacterium]